MSAVQRLDAALVARGLSASRTLARKAVEAGRVSVQRAGHPAALVVNKPAATVDDADQIFVQADDADTWVSRGALKLIGALDACGIAPDGLICLDVGQSTGGFTDVLLHRGATRVLGLDVGHGQLHPRLKSDARVHCIEGFNARDVDRSNLREALVRSLDDGNTEAETRTATNATADAALCAVDNWMPASGFSLIVADVSFISLLKISAGLKTLLSAEGHGLWLVKPQFEVGPQNIGKGGIVKPEALGAAFEDRICSDLRAQGFTVKRFFDSPIEGGDGNREYFVWVSPERT